MVLLCKQLAIQAWCQIHGVHSDRNVVRGHWGKVMQQGHHLFELALQQSSLEQLEQAWAGIKACRRRREKGIVPEKKKRSRTPSSNISIVPD